MIVDRDDSLFLGRPGGGGTRLLEHDAVGLRGGEGEFTFMNGMELLYILDLSYFDIYLISIHLWRHDFLRLPLLSVRPVLDPRGAEDFVHDLD